MLIKRQLPLLILLLLGSFAFSQAGSKITGGAKQVGGGTFGKAPIVNGQGPITIHVSPSGNDSNNGDPNHPVKTLDRGRLLIRGIPGSTLSFDWNGDAYLATPGGGCPSLLCMDAGDSGTSNAPMLYKAGDGYRPTVSGGVLLTPGGWVAGATACDGDCKQYSYSLNGSVIVSSENLFFNGERRYRPRSTTSSYLYSNASCWPANQVGGQCQQLTTNIRGCQIGQWECYDRFKFNGSDVPLQPHGLGLKDVEIDNFEKWTMSRMRLKSVSTGLAILTGPTEKNYRDNGFLCAQGTGNVCSIGHRFLVENDPANLTQPKQFYLDRCPGCSFSVTTPAATWTLTYNADASDLATQTGNNTSSTLAFNFLTNPANTGARTPFPVPIAGNTNFSDLHTYLYSGSTSKILFHWMPWWCDPPTSNITVAAGTFAACNNHIGVGYDEDETARIAAQVNRMKRLNGYGAFVDWYGFQHGDSTQAPNLVRTNTLANYLTNSGIDFHMGIVIDKGSFSTKCPKGSTDQTACITAELIASADYIRDNYANKPWYLKEGSNPIVGSFWYQPDWSGTNWTQVRADLKAHTDLYATPFKYVAWTETSGDPRACWSLASVDGCFAWMSTPDTWSLANELLISKVPTYYDDFYADALSHPTKIAVGLLKKGMDDNMASWGSNRVTSQLCGTTWLNVAAKINAAFSSSTQLEWVQVGTFNDKEEGHSVEEGIENCYSLTGGLIVGDTLSWTLTPTDITWATPSTLAGYTVWYANAAGTMFRAASNLSVNTTSILLKNIVPPGTWNIYLQLKGRALFRNHMLGPFAYSQGQGTLPPDDPSNGNNVVVLPQVQKLLSFNGTHDVTFTGIGFAHDNWTPPQGGLGDTQGSPEVPAAISLIDTSRVIFNGSTFRDIQAWGVELLGSGAATSSANQIINSLFYEIGGGAIRVGSQPCVGAGQQISRCTVPDTEANVTQSNIIQNNQIIGIGRVIPSGIGTGVFVGNSHHNTVQFNEVGDVYGGAISLGRTLGYEDKDGSLTCSAQNAAPRCLAYDNTVSYNYLHDIGEGVTSDFGGIYISNANSTGNVISNNFIRDVTHDTVTPDGYGGNGLYCDQGCSHNQIFNNMVVRASTRSMFNNRADVDHDIYSQDNHWYNNVFVWPGSECVKRGGEEANSFTLEKSICVFGHGTQQRGSSTVATVMAEDPGLWSCYANDALTPVPCGQRWTFDYMNWFPVGISFDFLLANPHGHFDFDGQGYTFTHYSTLAAWQAASTLDSHSLSTPPLFADYSYPADNYDFQSGAAGYQASIQFTAFPYKTFGRTNTSLTAPAVGPAFPLQLVDPITFYGQPGAVIPPPPGSSNDQYELAGDLCNFQSGAASADGPAQLPQNCFYTDPSVVISTGTVRTVNNVSDWNAAWAAAVCGDIIEVTAGVSLTATSSAGLSAGKNCDGTHWITVRSSAYAQLPAYGTRATPCYAGVTSLPGRPAYSCSPSTNRMFKIVSGNFVGGGTLALSLVASTNHIKFEGVEITRTAGTGNQGALIKYAGGGNGHIIFDHYWFHGNNTDETVRSMVMDRASYFSILDGTITDMTCVSSGSCTDAQAILGGINNTDCTGADKAWKIVNNFLEGAAETIMIGGGSACIIPSDIEIRRNHMFKPLTWNPSDATFDPTLYGGKTPIVKNLFELKSGNRVFLEGNILENSWSGFGQLGQGLTLGPRTQVGACPICAVTNVVYRYGKQKTTGTTWELFFAPVSGSWAVGGNNWSIHDIINDNYFYPACNSCSLTQASEGPEEQPGAPTAASVLHHVQINHVTSVPANPAKGAFNYSMGVSGALISSGLNMHDIGYMNSVFGRGKLAGTFNVIGGGDAANCAFQVLGPDGKLHPQDGKEMMDACWPPYTFGGNAILSTFGGTTVWPGTNCLSETTYDSLFVNYGSGLNGDYHIKSTSPCHLAGTDGTDPGANIDAVNTATSGVD